MEKLHFKAFLAFQAFFFSPLYVIFIATFLLTGHCFNQHYNYNHNRNEATNYSHDLTYEPKKILKG